MTSNFFTVCFLISDLKDCTVCDLKLFALCSGVLFCGVGVLFMLASFLFSVMQTVMNHKEAWPFMDPVEEEYAPGYYDVIDVSNNKK